MWLLSPQILILVIAMALSGTVGWRMTASHYQAKLLAMKLEAMEAAEKAEELNHALRWQVWSYPPRSRNATPPA